MSERLMETGEYAAMYHSEMSLWWYVALRDMLSRMLARHSSAGAKILDAGCGTGMNAVFLQASGYHVAAAIEPSWQALQFSRSRGIEPLTRGSLLSLPFSDASFDVVCCLDVLGILTEPQRRQAVRELYRVTRAGGIVIVHAAALEFLRSQHDDVINWQRRFTRQELKQLLLEEGKHDGAELLRLSYRVTALFPAVAAVKLIKRVLRSRTGTSSSDQQLTPGLLNGFLTALSLSENRILERIDLPFGSSLLAVVRVGRQAPAQEMD